MLNMDLSSKINPGEEEFKEKSKQLIDKINSIRLSASSNISTLCATTRSAKTHTFGESARGSPKHRFDDYKDPTYIQSLIQLEINELFHEGLNMVELRPEKFYMPDEKKLREMFPELDDNSLKYKLSKAEEVFSNIPKGLPKRFQNLANLLMKEEKGELRLDKERLQNFIDLIGWNDYVLEIHPTDVMFNPILNDFDVFSVTTGDINKIGLFYMDMMDFLSEFNKDKLADTSLSSYITFHLTTYEEFQNLEGQIFRFGDPTPDGSREAQWGAHLLLKYLEDNFKGNNVEIGIETGPGLRETKYCKYFIENEPYFFLGLLKGRKHAKLVHDFAHGEFKTSENKKVKHILYAVERIGKYHVSGNTKKPGTLDPVDDLHEPPNPDNLTTYWDTITLAKIVSKNITFSPEFTIKKIEDVDVVQNYFSDLSSDFTREDYGRYSEWVDTLERADLGFHPDNFDDKKIEKLLRVGDL